MLELNVTRQFGTKTKYEWNTAVPPTVNEVAEALTPRGMTIRLTDDNGTLELYPSVITDPTEVEGQIITLHDVSSGQSVSETGISQSPTRIGGVWINKKTHLYKNRGLNQITASLAMSFARTRHHNLGISSILTTNRPSIASAYKVVDLSQADAPFFDTQISVTSRETLARDLELQIFRLDYSMLTLLTNLDQVIESVDATIKECFDLLTNYIHLLTQKSAK
jgi:hypothetical protein